MPENRHVSFLLLWIRVYCQASTGSSLFRGVYGTFHEIRLRPSPGYRASRSRVTVSAAIQKHRIHRDNPNSKQLRSVPKLLRQSPLQNQHSFHLFGHRVAIIFMHGLKQRSILHALINATFIILLNAVSARSKGHTTKPKPNEVNTRVLANLS